MQFIKNLVRNEDGATAIEYGLIAALIAVAAIAAMQSLGTQLTSTFGGVANCLDKSSGDAAGAANCEETSLVS